MTLDPVLEILTLAKQGKYVRGGTAPNLSPGDFFHAEYYVNLLLYSILRAKES
jgi:hypothetical protein